MLSAIILLTAVAGTEKALLHCLREQAYVQEAHLVQSAYDIVVRVKAETFAKLSANISLIKNLLPKPQSVTTMVIVEDQTVPLTYKLTKKHPASISLNQTNNAKVTGEFTW
jgi:hypothetical protein